jgi:hypothetical protein
MDFTAFSHGQMQSKLWLCENLEKYIPQNSTVAILGSWYNLLGMMLLARNHEKYNFILGIDKDPKVIEIADKLCESWMVQPNVKMKNIFFDANDYNLEGYNVVINCSVEHMDSTRWFRKLNSGTLVCIQSSDVIESDQNFDIKNPNRNLDDLCYKFPMRTYYHKKTKQFKYNEWGYNRLMTIGIK